MLKGISLLQYMYDESTVTSNALFELSPYQHHWPRAHKNNYGGFNVLGKPLDREGSETTRGYLPTIQRHFAELTKVKGHGLLVKHNGNGEFASGIEEELGLMQQVREKRIDPLVDLHEKIVGDPYHDHSKIYFFRDGRSEVRYFFAENEEWSAATTWLGDVFNFFVFQRGQFLIRDRIHIQHQDPLEILQRLQPAVRTYYLRWGLVKWETRSLTLDSLLSYIIADSQQDESNQILPRVVENPKGVLTHSPIEGIKRIVLENDDLKQQEIGALIREIREKQICGHTLIKIGADKERLARHYKEIFGKNIIDSIEREPVFYRI